jgi:transaldolase
MKLFIDTANLNDIENSLSTGAVEGVTTNPSLLSKEPKENFIKHIKKIVSLCKEIKRVPLSVEVFAETPSEMYEQAFSIYKESDYTNVNIKIPVGYEELKIINKLSSSGVAVNCTCCFTATQMEMAALSGARYVSLFYNRLLDCGGDPIEVIKKVRQFIETNELNCEIISGSIRSAKDVSDAWDAGSHIVTAGFSVIRKMMIHPSTDTSVEEFLNDFREWIK